MKTRCLVIKNTFQTTCINRKTTIQWKTYELSQPVRNRFYEVTWPERNSIIQSLPFRPSHLTKIVPSRPRYFINISLEYPFRVWPTLYNTVRVQTKYPNWNSNTNQYKAKSILELNGTLPMFSIFKKSNVCIGYISYS